MKISLKNKTALITGGTRGIGKACVELFLEAGANVYALAKNKSTLEKLAAGYPEVKTILFDLSNQNAADYQKLAGEIKQIDVLIHNAGFFEPLEFTKITPENWVQHFQINVNAAYLLVQSFWDRFTPRKGSIVLVNSLAGVAGLEKFATAAAYTASKMALSGLMEVLSVEAKPLGIRVNCVSPGATDTEMLRSVYPDMKPDFSAHEIARHVLFWASEASAPVSGANVPLKL